MVVCTILFINFIGCAEGCIKSIHTNTALETGCWLHHIHSGDFVEEGQVLGRITDVFGNTLTTYYAEQTGVILYVCPALASPKGTILVAYGIIKEFDDEE